MSIVSPPSPRLDHLLSASAARAPQALAALEPGGRAIRYGELNAYAGAVASALTELGVAAGDRVGICATKNIGALAAVMGALRAGAAYVPVDAHSPLERIAYIFNDCDVAAIVVGASAAPDLVAALGDVHDWRHTAFPAPAAHAEDLVILSRARRGAAPPLPDLAYILYTSGSTGRPKGVMHTHASALAFIDWCSAEFKPGAADRFSSHAPFHFDLSILDIYVPLKHGASVMLIDSETGKMPGVLAELMTKQKITHWYSTPSTLRIILEYGKVDQFDFSALRVVNFAGEVFPLKHLRALMSAWPHAVFYNLYGPTETNVCTYYRLPSPLPDDPDYALPIGSACSGDRLRIAGSDGAEAACGEEGELLVTGGSVMAGYWNLPERNAEAFVSDGAQAWYRTGDIVRELPSGDLAFLGRRDRMVKRRGFRIELGEIESALHKHSAIAEAAAVTHTDAAGDVQICAFYVWTDAAPPSLLRLKQFCAAHLPHYMAPDRFVAIDALPKTSTDKIDYQRLKALVP